MWGGFVKSVKRFQIVTVCPGKGQVKTGDNVTVAKKDKEKDREIVVPLEWDVLWERARLSFEDADEDSYARRSATAAKKLKRAGLSAPPVDVDAAKRAICVYATNFVYNDALKQVGISHVDMATACDLVPEVAMAREYVRRLIRDVEDSDDESVAQTAKATLVAAAGGLAVPKQSVDAAKFMLGHIKEKFGESGGKRVAEEDDPSKKKPNGSGGIVINIVGDAAAKLLQPNRPDGRSGGVFIDV